MKKSITVILFVYLASAGYSATRFEYEWVGFTAPQSVCSFGRYLFVSNLGSGNAESPDGYISKLTKEGKIIDKYWVSGLKAPRGMAVMNNCLFVADGGVVRGYNLLTQEEEFALELPETDSLIDVESLRDGVSFAVSDSKNGLIYRVYYNGDFYPLILDPIDGVTGLLYKSRNLYFCTSSVENGEAVGKVGYLRVKYSKIELIPYFFGEVPGQFRGITVHSDSIFVTDRGPDGNSGRIFCFNTDENMTYPIWEQDLNRPGDFLIDGDNLWVPTEGDGKIKYIVDIH